MNVQEIMEQVYREAGEPTDLSPYSTFGDESTFDVTTAGGIKLLRYVNQALVRIANWVFPDGGHLRLRGMMCKAYFQSKAPVADQATAGAASTITLPGLATNVVDQYRGWVIRITAGTGVGQTRLILSNTVEMAGNIVATVHSPWDTVPDATSVVELYKNFFQFVGTGAAPYQAFHIPIDAVTGVQDVLKVRDLESLSDLEPTARIEVFTAGMLQPGTPTQYRVMGNQIVMDVPVADARTYEMIYLKQPAALTNAAQVPDLPLQYHEAVSLWAVHNVQRMNSDFDGAYATKRELIDLMSTLRTQGASDYDLEQTGMTAYE